MSERGWASAHLPILLIPRNKGCMRRLLNLRRVMQHNRRTGDGWLHLLFSALGLPTQCNDLHHSNVDSLPLTRPQRLHSMNNRPSHFLLAVADGCFLWHLCENLVAALRFYCSSIFWGTLACYSCCVVPLAVPCLLHNSRTRLFLWCFPITFLFCCWRRSVFTLFLYVLCDWWMFHSTILS